MVVTSCVSSTTERGRVDLESLRVGRTEKSLLLRTACRPCLENTLNMVTRIGDGLIHEKQFGYYAARPQPQAWALATMTRNIPMLTTLPIWCTCTASRPQLLLSFDHPDWMHIGSFWGGEQETNSAEQNLWISCGIGYDAMLAESLDGLPRLLGD